VGFETVLLRPTSPYKGSHGWILTSGLLLSPQLLITSLEVRFAMLSAFTPDFQGFQCKQESLLKAQIRTVSLKHSVTFSQQQTMRALS
jgi:hypothetical protein